VHVKKAWTAAWLDPRLSAGILANERWCLEATAVPALTFLVAWRSLKQERVWALYSVVQ
jgi:hypothetical protein